MDLKKKTQLLRNLLPKVAPEELLDDPKSSLAAMGMTESTGLESAARGIKKIKTAETLEAPEANGLEAIIHQQFRPAPFVINDDYHTPPAPWEYLGKKSYRKRIKTAIRSVGRIELPGNTRSKYGGTGFIVGPNLIMTNRHVAEIFATGLGQLGLAFKPKHQSAINFRREQLPSDTENLSVTKVVMIHPYWDMALLQVEGFRDEREPLTLSIKDPDEIDGTDVVIIGYPALDMRNDIDLQNRIFGGMYDVKRMQPGYLRTRREIQSFENKVNAITHDASTLGGNSGSAVIDANTGEVAALHFAGLYLDANFAVPAYELARDRRIVDAGVKFAGDVKPTSDWAGRWDFADQPAESQPLPRMSRSDAATQTPAAAPNPAVPTATVPAATPSVQIQANQVTWTIPLSVSISLGTPQISIGGAAVPGQLTPPAAPAQVEGLFWDSESEIVAKAYSRFSAANLEGAGFSWAATLAAGAASYLAYGDHPEVVDVCRNRWGFDTCDFIQVNDTECFVATTAKVVLLSFRGTAGVADWVRDLTVFSTDTEYGSVHEGFYLGLQQVKSKIGDVLKRVGAQNKSFVITGHSLGGALATIAAPEFEQDYPVSAIYTFGQPAVGKEDFRTHMNAFSDRIHRIVNDDDFITMVPPGYVHVGKLYRFGYWGGVSHESVAAAPAQETPMMTEAQFRDFKASIDKGEITESPVSAEEGILPGPSLLDHKMWRYLNKTMKQMA